MLPVEVNPYRKHAAVQKWYGEYSLPAAPYVVPTGTDLAEYGRTNKLDNKSNIFLKNGFIIVNFDLETIRNAEPSFTIHSYRDSSGQPMEKRRFWLSAPRSLRLKNEFG